MGESSAIISRQTGLRFLGVLSGPLLFLSFPTYSLTPFIFVCLVPLLLAVREWAWWKRFLLGLMTGMIIHIGITYWVKNTMETMSGLSSPVATLLLLAFALISGLQYALFSVLVEPVRKYSGALWPLTVASLFVAIDMVFPMLFPWYMANALYRWLPCIQILDLVGVYGVTWILVYGNAVLTDTIWAIHDKKRPPYPLIVSVLAIWAVTVGYGYLRLHQLAEGERKGTLRFAMVQPNILPPEKVSRDPEVRSKIFETLRNLTLKVPQGTVDLIIWPEGAFPHYFELTPKAVQPKDVRVVEEVPNFTSYLTVRLAERQKAHMMVGTLRKPSPEEKTRNSVVWIAPDGRVMGVYDKMRLLAFGERMPFSDVFPSLKHMIRGVSDMGAGEAFVVIEIGPFKIVPSICYEAIFPEFTRESLEKGGDILLNLTNDEWFGDTIAPHLHLMAQTARAIENRVPLLRSTNTGITAVVEESGRILLETPVFQEGVYRGEISPRKMWSFYRRFGNLICHGVILASIVIVGLGYFARRRKPSSRKNEASGKSGP